MHTLTPFIISHTLLCDFWYPFLTWNKKRKIRQDQGSPLDTPRTDTTHRSTTQGFFGFVFLYLKVFREDTALKLLPVPIFPTPSSFHSFIHSLYLTNQSSHFSVLNDTEDSIKFKELPPLIPVMSSWMCYNDITQSILTQNKISQIQSLNTSSM